MVNDPNAAVNVDNFGEFGCFLACHNYSRHMPEWVSANGHDGKYIDPVQATGSASGDNVLDLWHWRGARSNPIGRADDQRIIALDFIPNDGNGSDDGGRKGDAGQSVFASQNIVDGNPEFLLDPNTTSGKFAFSWDNFWETPFFYMTQDDAVQIGPLAPNAGTIAYADAVLLGYAPTEGDTIPRRILRAGEGSRADITAYGTTFTPETPDRSYGVWNVQMQRALDTGNADDIALVPGNIYEAGFEVHLWEYTTRDHYVSFPMTFSVGPGAADIQAVSIPGSGPELLPNWQEIPKTRLYLFQPGITTWEFLTGENEAQGKEYLDAQDQLVDQNHGGSGGVTGGTACTVCHVVRSVDGGNAMEDVTQQRGGIWEDTPVAVMAPPPDNQPPVADAGTDQTVDIGMEVTLDGSGSSDADGDQITYSWSLVVPGGSAAVLSGADTDAPTFTADIDGDYEATLIVNDGEFDSDPDSVTVTATTAIDGVQLYADNCSACHGPLATSTKLGRSAQQIQNAIDQGIGGMGIPSLEALTPEEVQAISDALAIP
jgi:mono/diheme cytochrome c family protein